MENREPDGKIWEQGLCTNSAILLSQISSVNIGVCEAETLSALQCMPLLDVVLYLGNSPKQESKERKDGSRHMTLKRNMIKIKRH